jgi:hypothetical protein
MTLPTLISLDDRQIIWNHVMKSFGSLAPKDLVEAPDVVLTHPDPKRAATYLILRDLVYNDIHAAPRTLGFLDLHRFVNIASDRVTEQLADKNSLTVYRDRQGSREAFEVIEWAVEKFLEHMDEKEPIYANYRCCEELAYLHPYARFRIITNAAYNACDRLLKPFH